MTPARKDILIGLVVLALAIAMPFILPGRYLIGQFTLFFIWATVVTQWNLVFGVAGIFSLAQMAIFAFGGYVTAMLGLYGGWNLWAALPFGAIGALLFSLIVGLACLRLRGPYVALLTLAIAQVMYLLIITDTACFYMGGCSCRFTGGTRGFANTAISASASCSVTSSCRALLPGPWPGGAGASSRSSSATGPWAPPSRRCVTVRNMPSRAASAFKFQMLVFGPRPSSPASRRRLCRLLR